MDCFLSFWLLVGFGQQRGPAEDGVRGQENMVGVPFMADVCGIIGSWLHPLSEGHSSCQVTLSACSSLSGF